MSTKIRLALGLGLLTLLVVACCAAVLSRVNSAADRYNEMIVARQRMLTAYEMEANLLGFALGMKHFLADRDPESHAEAVEDAEDADRYHEEYRELAQTQQHHELADEFGRRWETLQTLAIPLLDPSISGDQIPGLLDRFVEEQRDTEDWLDQELRAGASADVQAMLSRSEQDIRTIGSLAAGLLLGGTLLAAITSLLVGRGVISNEQAVAEQAERLRTTLASIGDGVIATDADGHVTMMNAVARQLTGWAIEDALGKPVEAVFRIVSEESRQMVDNPVRQALKKGGIVGLANHTLLISRDGSERPIDDSAAPIRCAEGDVVGCVLVFHDISQRRHQEKRFQSLLSVVTDVPWTADAEGAFVEPQENWERYTGQPWEEHRDFGWTIAVHPDDRESLMQTWETAKKHGELREVQTRVWHAASKSYRHIAVRAVRLLSADGKVLEWVGTCTDVEDEFQREQQLRASERHRRLSVDSSAIGTWNVDMTTRTMVDDERFREIFYGSASAKSSYDIAVAALHPEDRDRVLAAIAAATSPVNPARYEIEYRVVHPDGDIVWVLAKGAANFEGSGPRRRLVSFDGTVTDITEQKEFETSLQEARDEAEAASRSRGEFLANMSHEIRTPMTAILGHAEMLSGQIDDREQLRSVETIRRNGQFLLEIINDILDLSKIDAGKLQIDRQSVRVDQIVADLHALLSIRAKEKQISFIPVIDGEIPATIETDPTRLRQVLLNLIGNAIKFTDSGSVRLVVRYRKRANQMQFDCIDTGIGISEADLQKLFQPFSQVDSSHTRSYSGTGLGLAISTKLAAALGGKITVRSNPGVGSTFTLTIDCGKVAAEQLIDPRLSHPEMDVSVEDAAAAPVQIAGRVLVVDDRRDIRFLAQHFVERAGGEVVLAVDGQDALETMERCRSEGPSIDLVLLDMQMPVMDGYETARRLRERGFTMPIVALTANAMADDRDKCLASGCDAFASKPLDSAELVRLIADLLRR